MLYTLSKEKGINIDMKEKIYKYFCDKKLLDEKNNILIDEIDSLEFIHMILELEDIINEKIPDQYLIPQYYLSLNQVYDIYDNIKNDKELPKGIVPSIFNVTNNSENEITLFNTLYSKKIIFKGNVNEFYELMKDCNNFWDEELVEKLYKYKFLVKKTSDEIALNEYLYNTKLYQKPESIFLSICLGYSCNFNCTYCLQKHTNSYMSKKTAESIIEYIKLNIKETKKLIIEFTGGEPLLYKDSIQFISKNLMSLCSSSGIKFTAQVITNGYLLDYNMAKDLFSYGIKDYHITIDGDKNTHDMKRKTLYNENTFEKIIQNILSILNSDLKNDINFRVRINSDINIYNDYVNIINNLKTILNNKVDIYFENTLIKDNTSDNSFKCTLEKNKLDEMNKYINSELNKLININQYCKYLDKNNYYIDFDGNVKKCPSSEISIGKLSENGVLNLDLYETSKLYKKYDQKYFSQCVKCAVLPICQKMVCPIDNSYCDYMKNIIDENIQSINCDEIIELI